jgi:hypothetical protein
MANLKPILAGLCASALTYLCSSLGCNRRPRHSLKGKAELAGVQ